MFGRIADTLQLAWALIYWNARKTRFRLARGRTPCPCQSPSDSGRAMETGCDPSLLFNKPGSFRHVCPLLKQNAQGLWLCSVDTPEVRPFWTRAVVIFASLFLCLYLVGTATAFSLLRSRGYPISYYEVAWPGAWSNFHVIQSRYFAQKASRALAQRDPGEAVMALSIAYQLDRTNFAVGSLFARLTQVSQPGLSDQVYQELAREHPEHALDVYTAWYEALLWRADFTAITAVTQQALALDQQHRPAWINALLFSLHREPNRSVLQELSRNGTADSRAVFELELQTAKGGAEARRILLNAINTPDRAPFLEYYVPRRLIELGQADAALNLLNKTSSGLPLRDKIALSLEAFEKLGLRSSIREQTTALIKGPINSATSELLIGYFVRHPDRDLFAQAFDAFRTNPPSNKEAAYRDWAGWLCAAGANGDFTRYAEAGRAMRQIAASEFRAFEPLRAFFRGEGASARIESYLPAVQPLPLDVTYALLERYYLPRGATDAQKP